MKNLPLIFIGLIVAMPFVVVAQPTGTYVSPAFVNFPPQVNATNFINSGVWNINTTPQPYKTFSTYNYTNTGTMNSSIGWQFDHGPYPTGPRGWSANFLNDNSGVISASDGFFAATYYFYTASYLLIYATNVVNKGNLKAGPFGEIVIQGSGVNLSRSGLEITPIQGGGSVNGITNFSPDIAIFDQYWYGGTNYHAFGTDVWDGSAVAAQDFFPVGEPCEQFGDAQIGPFIPVTSSFLTNNYGPFALVTTNSSGGTNPPILLFSNLVRQAIFVYVTDPSIGAAVGFGQEISPTNIYRAMAAQLSTTSTNVVTKTVQTSYIYVVDNLAAIYTNGALAKNNFLNPSAACTDPTYRPNSVVVARAINGTYSGGDGNVVPSDFFYDPLTFSNRFSVGRADAYSALVDNLAAQPLSGFDLSNAPGKIIINAKDLDLSKVRMSAGAEILIQASNLVSSAGAAMDCQNLSYNFGSTNGLLNITNLAFNTVQRFRGTINEWSGVWTNYQVNVYDSYVTNSAATNAPFYTNSPITIVTEIDLAITVVDASGLVSTVPVTVQNLVLNSTNIVISDVMNVVNTLLFNGQSLTIQGGITLSGLQQNWNIGTAPNLRYFTNNGSLQIPNVAHFGDDGSTNYAVFVNNGTLAAGLEIINSSLFLAGGSQTASQGFYVTTASGKVENGSITSDQDVQFTAGTLKLNNSKITADGQLYFKVTGSLFDAGGSSGNILMCANGFNLAIKPATGDLLGSALETTTPMFAAVDHYWSGLDKGAAPAGYTNNEAVGQLILNEGVESEFIFHATSTSNAIYADLLDLSQCPNFLDPDVLTIDPNFKIYYAAVKLPASFTIPPNTNGIPQEPEEYLNGKLGGHLAWVSNFAGPNSSVDVLINGQTFQMNKALRYSKIIDSNGNGIPNYYDLNPFDPVIVLSGAVVQTNQPPTGAFAISWMAAPHTIYQVQYSTSMIPPNWMPLKNYTNNASASIQVTVWDTNSLSGQRYYRVSHP